MRYSLLNRFYGTLWGVSFGSLLGIEFLNASIQQNSPAIAGDYQLTRLLKSNHFKKLSFLQQQEPYQTLIGKWGIQGLKALAESLITHQGWNEKDFLDFKFKFCSDHAHPSTFRADSLSGKDLHLTLGSDAQVLTPSAAALIVIPAVLLVHEDKFQRHQCLGQLARTFWEDEGSGKAEGMFIVAEAIAQALTETLNPGQFMAQILTHPPVNTTLATLLTTLQGLIEQRVSLAKAVEQFVKTEKKQLTPDSSPDIAEHLPLILALYCFLSTPEDPKLSMLRAVQIGYAPQMTTALCGALCGAYNGKGSFPVQWQIAIHRLSEVYTKQESADFNFTAILSEAETLKFATDLFAIWSGVYNTASPSTAVLARRVIASADVIKPI